MDVFCIDCDQQDIHGSFPTLSDNTFQFSLDPRDYRTAKEGDRYRYDSHCSPKQKPTAIKAMSHNILTVSKEIRVTCFDMINGNASYGEEPSPEHIYAAAPKRNTASPGIIIK